jgi:translation initiation factor IF-2
MKTNSSTLKPSAKGGSSSGGKILSLKPRPPIIVVMGHVDHGKTTLLDYIRKSNVASREAGGITQAIAAYEIEHPSIGPGNKKKITFIDTPGHEAFSKMRSRGTAAADLAILVVAADEGVKPQTQEVINILNETKTPFVVALNKIDKPGANIEKTKGDLATAGVVVEGYGGQVSYQGISAKTGQGVDELLDHLILEAEVQNLTYDPEANASGYVLEARKNPQRGIEVSVIITNGTLKPGLQIATETASGKVKILEDFTGKSAKALEPSAPALILGFEKMPEVGEMFYTGDDAKVAQVLGEEIVNNPAQYEVGGDKTLNIILRASDAGSLQALSEILQGMSDLSAAEGDARSLKIVTAGVGEVSDGDVKMAVSTKATIIGFKSRVAKAAAVLAESQKVTIVTSQIIYELIKNIEDVILKKKGKVSEGELEVLVVFNQEKLSKQLVGGKVTIGAIRAKMPCQIIREKAIISEGHITTLRQQKKEVDELAIGTEGGLVVGASVAIQVGDKIIIK